MKFNIELTWSKLVAVLLMSIAFYLDIVNTGIAATMYCTPFVVLMITGKQAIGLAKDKINGSKT